MRALVIDDSRAMRRIVSANPRGSRLRGAARPATAARASTSSTSGWVPDLVCVDWNMPVMDGLQFVSAVRSNPAWRSMTIMMVTSESEHTPDRARAGRRRPRVRDQAVHRRRHPRQARAARPAPPGGRPVTHASTPASAAAAATPARHHRADRRGHGPVDRRGRLDRPGRRGRVPRADARRAARRRPVQLGRRRRPVDRAPSSSPPAAQTAAELTRGAARGARARRCSSTRTSTTRFGEIANVVGGNVKAALPGPVGAEPARGRGRPRRAQPGRPLPRRRPVARRAALHLRAGRPAGPARSPSTEPRTTRTEHHCEDPRRRRQPRHAADRHPHPASGRLRRPRHRRGRGRRRRAGQGVVGAAGPGPVGLEHAEHDRHRVPAGAALVRARRCRSAS